MPQEAVLLVEDDRMMGESLTEILHDSGYAVALVGSGSEALDLLAQQEFAVVVSDIRMPAVDGIAVLHAARQSAAPPEVILLTGHAALETSLAALREGAFDYLLKPCQPERLVQRVGDAVESRSARLHKETAVQHIMHAFQEMTEPDGADTPPTHGNGTAALAAEADSDTPADDSVLRVGALTIGDEHYSAMFNGEDLHLTPTEHALLREMATHPGKVFTYRELVFAMHGYDVSTMEAKILLKTHIRNLRAKINPDVLVNIRGTGYKLVVPEAAATPKRQPPALALAASMG